ncbi:MAG TPA: phosphatidylserine decarboxylase [Candidatus Binataceae bacterium]|nr:phosphatidylserine decarboxylase [Candidatus Binataceae bacterium]
MPIALAIVAVGIVVAAVGAHAIGIVLIAIAAAIAAFFRDPQRRTTGNEEAVISGADGRVCDIASVPMPGAGEETICTRVSVFMSPLDVHVNRAPVSGDVVSLTHVKGEFRAAFRDLASEHNERNVIRIRDERGRDHLLIQVAGYLARRIVCYLRLHQRLARGERVGLIMFGSRVDHFLPQDYRVTVQIGDRVRAGETIIGERLE